MRAERRRRLVLPPWKLLLMHLPFRLFCDTGPGFAPGIRNSLAWMKRLICSRLFDRDRLKYALVRLHRFWSR